MIPSLLLFGVLMSPNVEDDAPPTDSQVRLLKVFRGEFISITPGRGKFPKSFSMGQASGPKDQQPAHEVTFAYDFQIAKYEVPQNLWEAVMGSNPSRWKGPRNSVEELSYLEAVEFCKKATRLLRSARLIKADEVVRLPSEAEWEYVARAGTKTVYSFGDDAGKLGDFGWFHGNAAGNDPPVGVKKPNAWGLYDVHGYLWEWCSDRPHADYQGAPCDGSPWVKDGKQGQRLLRGGSWKDNADLCTSAYRRLVSEKLRDDAVGLRCVLVKQKP